MQKRQSGRIHQQLCRLALQLGNIPALLARINRLYFQSKISIEYTDVTEMEVRVSPNHMIELRGPLIDKVSKLSANGDLHNFDIQLFWKAIRNNIKDRIASI